MSKLTKREDYQALMDYIVGVCGQAVANADPVTPVALAGQYGECGPEHLAVYDLSRLQRQSPERSSAFVQQLSDSGQYDFVAYIASALIQEADDCPPLAEATREPRPAVLALIYTDDCQALAHHPVDPVARRLIPGELHFVGQSGLTVQGALARPTPLRH